MAARIVRGSYPLAVLTPSGDRVSPSPRGAERPLLSRAEVVPIAGLDRRRMRLDAHLAKLGAPPRFSSRVWG